MKLSELGLWGIMGIFRIREYGRSRRFRNPSSDNLQFGSSENMARYEHLQIYKAAYDLNVYFEKTVRYFSRYNKYTLGTELRNSAREIVKLIIRANNENDKLQTLLELRELLEQLKFTVHLCKEINAFNNFNSFQVAINQIIDISRQNEGWIKTFSKL
ncbi:MAG: four helix bundle protein [Desulfobacteraceae bacterium]|nr:four helix bundle protein [Desulfobacteraceae bacterium]